MGSGRELFGRRKDGSEFPIEVALSSVQSGAAAAGPNSGGSSDCIALVVVTNLSLRQGVSEHQQRERQFQAFIETAPTGFVVMGHDGRIVFANRMACDMFGWPRDELEGQMIEVLLPEQSRAGHPALRDSFLSSPAHRSMGAGRELCGQRRDGSLFPMEIGLQMLPATSTMPAVALASIVDISLRLHNAALQRVRDAAERDAVARSSLLATMSHEIRTPLTGIVGCMELLGSLAEEHALPPEATDLIDTGHKCSTQLLEIINNILDYSKLGAGSVEIEHAKFDLRELLAVTGAIVAIPAREKGLAWVTHIGASVPPMLFGDPGRVRQILINLASNAVKFTPTGGAVTVSAACFPLTSARRASASPGSDAAAGVDTVRAGVASALRQKLSAAATATATAAAHSRSRGGWSAAPPPSPQPLHATAAPTTPARHPFGVESPHSTTIGRSAESTESGLSPQHGTVTQLPPIGGSVPALQPQLQQGISTTMQQQPHQGINRGISTLPSASPAPAVEKTGTAGTSAASSSGGGSSTNSSTRVPPGAVAMRLEIRVTDTGIGVPPDVQPRLFHAFAQADTSTTRKFGGTGLGLAISRRLAVLMSGDIRIESPCNPDGSGGSCFVVEIGVAALPDPAALARLCIPAESTIAAEMPTLKKNDQPLAPVSAPTSVQAAFLKGALSNATPSRAASGAPSTAIGAAANSRRAATGAPFFGLRVSRAPSEHHD